MNYKKNKKEPYLLIAPTFILYITFFLYPFLKTMYLSLFKWNGFTPNMKFVGLGNYTKMLGDKNLLKALFNTIEYSFFTVIFSLAIGFLVALWLDKKIALKETLKTIYFLPRVVAMVAIAVVWGWIFSSSEYGLANLMLGFIGVDAISWLGDPKYALKSVIVISVWRNVGYVMIIYFAGLKAISRNLYEAADIDGATPFQQVINITIPLLKPSTLFLLVILTIDSFKIFDIVNVLTGGGPVGSTETLVTYIYKTGYEKFHMGYSSAIAVVLFLMIMGITMVQKKLINNEEV